jgi:cysteine desulfurase
MIYADNAATTPLDAAVFESMKKFLLDEYANASQTYFFAKKSKKALKIAREKIAACINAEPNEIYFTSGGSESDNWAVKGSAFADTKKQLTITSAFEHHAILNSCKAIEKFGYPIQYLQPTEKGLIPAESLKKIITNQTKLVSVMLANNEIGTIQPVKELCKIAHNHGALFHTDAVQAMGHIPIDVKNLGVDMLSASAHKFNAPKGIGFLYIRKGIKICSLIDGGNQEFGFRAGTENIAGIVGMAEALKNNYDSLEKNQQHIKKLENILLDCLNKSKIFYVKNGGENTLPGLISLSFENQSGESILHRFDLMGICISTGSACDSTNTKISHVLQAINLPENLAKGTVRISLGKYNTADEIIAIANAIKKLLSRELFWRENFKIFFNAHILYCVLLPKIL